MSLRRLLLPLFLLAAALPLRAVDSDAEVEARRVALELAGAFANEEFMLRDGHWCGEIAPGKETVVAVNLYAGNQYWFSVGSSEPSKLSVRLYDETGKPVAADSYEAAEHAAAGFSPAVSGQYFVGITPAETSARAYCLIYSYK